VYSRAQVFRHWFTATVAILRASPWIWLYEQPTSVYSFVACFVMKTTPCHIGNTAVGWPCIFDYTVYFNCFTLKHRRYIEVFHTDYAVFVDDLAAFLMCEVFPAIVNSLVDFGYNFLGVLSFGRTLGLFGQFALCFGQCGFIGFEKAFSLDFSTSDNTAKVFNPASMPTFKSLCGRYSVGTLSHEKITNHLPVGVFLTVQVLITPWNARW